jgi:hypothetical protein
VNYLKQKRSKLCLIAALTTFSCSLQAHELTTTISLDFEVSNNSRLVHGRDKVSDSLTTPALNIDYKLMFTNLAATIRYSLSRREYRDDTFDDRNDVLGEGTFRWTILTDKLFWNFYQNSNRLTIDTGIADSENNRTQRNVMQTGPEMKLKFGRNSFLTFNIDFVESSFDRGNLTRSNQAMFGARYQQGIGARTQVGFSGQYSDVKFDDKILDYTNERLGIDISGTGRRFQYELSFGPNTIRRNSGDSVSGAFLSFKASISSPNTTWGLSANRQLTDSSTGLTLNSNVANGLNNGDANFDSKDVVERSRAELSYQYKIVPDRITLGFNVFFDRQDFKILPRDREIRGANLDFTYRFTNNLSSTYRYEWEYQDYAESITSSQESVRRSHQLDARYTPNQKVIFILWISDNQRDFSTANRDYLEFVGGVTLQYKL